jgi:hypothetical protein
MSNELEKDGYVTVNYLLSHGFQQYTSVEEGHVCDIPFENNTDSLHFKEIEFHRQMFVVIISPYNGTPKDGFHFDVWVQDDAGCGFVSVPFPWYDLPIEYFESVYYGIRGHKPKRTIPIGEDADFEVIQPKQIENE